MGKEARNNMHRRSRIEGKTDVRERAGNVILGPRNGTSWEQDNSVMIWHDYCVMKAPTRMSDSHMQVAIRRPFVMNINV